jgi:hypothetical protein
MKVETNLSVQNQEDTIYMGTHDVYLSPGCESEVSHFLMIFMVVVVVDVYFVCVLVYTWLLIWVYLLSCLTLVRLLELTPCFGIMERTVLAVNLTVHTT